MLDPSLPDRQNQDSGVVGLRPLIQEMQEVAQTARDRATGDFWPAFREGQADAFGQVLEILDGEVGGKHG